MPGRPYPAPDTPPFQAPPLDHPAPQDLRRAAPAPDHQRCPTLGQHRHQAGATGRRGDSRGGREGGQVRDGVELRSRY